MAPGFEKTCMKSMVIIIYTLISAFSFSFPADQQPDLLIIEKDTLYLMSFPLEELNFQVRPFQYGNYDFPNTACYRGYHATWKVIDHKLFLTEISKADASREKVDIVQYFAMNNYSPTVINGFIFADWFSADLGCFPRKYSRFGCNFKKYNSRQYKPALRFDEGLLKVKKYKSN